MVDNHNAAADAAMSRSINAAKRPSVVCLRCGDMDVCWMKSKSGKSYMANQLITGIPMRGFHNCDEMPSFHHRLSADNLAQLRADRNYKGPIWSPKGAVT